MNKNEVVLNFRKLLEERFGTNFTIPTSEMVKFVQDLLDKKYPIKEINYSLIALYRDDYIDYYDLKDILDAFNLKLPIEFSFYSEQAKQVIRQIAPKVHDFEELCNYLYNYYYNYKIEFKVYEMACFLLGYELKDEFLNMDDDERRNKLWLLDKNNKTVVLQDAEASLFKICESFKYVSIDELLMPTKHYSYPMGFVFDYMDQNNIDDKVLVDGGLDRRKKYKFQTQTYLKKIECYRLIFILKMPVSIAKQFLTLAGYCFSPVIPQDVFFLDYLNGKYNKVDSLEELEDLARDKGVYVEAQVDQFPYPYWKK